jgi:hypothetical protein
MLYSIMGLFVSQATLPSGIQVSNVYMSFNGEVVYTQQYGTSGNVWQVSSHYKVFSDSQKSLPTNTRVNLNVLTSNANIDVYSELYWKLKEVYPQTLDEK